MVDIKEKGKALKINVTFKNEDAELVDVTNPLIKILRADGTSIITATALTWASTGTYSYIWDTTELLLSADYLITAYGTYAGHVLLNRAKVKLVMVEED